MKYYILLSWAAVLFIMGSCRSEESNTTRSHDTLYNQTMVMDAGGEHAGIGGTATEDEGTRGPGIIYDTVKKKAARGVKHVRRNPLECGNYPEASNRTITEMDVRHLSDWGYKIMLNEIYARHGQKFSDETLQSYFNKQDWYKGVSKDVSKKLSKIEQQNVAFLKSRQK